ncbi:ariadne-1 [Microdochium nivale]|nr:ariadne-1 [Microdochium nivale]
MEFPALSTSSPSQQHDSLVHNDTSRLPPTGTRRIVWKKFSESFKRAARYSSSQGRQQRRNTKQGGYQGTKKDALRDSHPIGRVLTLRAIPASLRCEDGDPRSTLPIPTTPLDLDLSDTRQLSTSDIPSARNSRSSSMRRKRHSLVGNDGLGILIEITRPAAPRHDEADTRYTESTEDGQPSQGKSSELVAPPVTLRDILMKTIISAQQRHPKRESTNEGVSATPGRERLLTPIQTRELLQALVDVTKTDGAAVMSLPLQQSVAVCAVCSSPKLQASAAGHCISAEDLTTYNRNTAEVESIDKVTPYIDEVVSRCPSLGPDAKNTLEQHVVAKGSVGISMECCGRYVCRICLSQTIRDGIQNGWWLDLPRRDREGGHDDGWIRCPASSCATVLPLNSSNISQQLQSLGVNHVKRLTSMFDQAKELRTALHTMTPRLTEKEIQRGLKMHKKLVKLGCAWPLLEAENPGQLTTLEHGRTCEPVIRSEVTVERVSVDYPSRRTTNTGTDDDSASVTVTRRVHIPMFSHLLRLPRVRKECAICAKTYHDFAPGSISSRPEGEDKGQKVQAVGEDSESNETPWQKATLGYPGDWMWQIFAFPPGHILPDCSTSNSPKQVHAKEAQEAVCKTCLSRSIEAQLDLLGTRLAERGISCPLPHGGHDSNHSLTFDEVRRLARSEVFARYDRLMTLAAVCSDEGFRWCLRPGCESGAVYDFPGRPLPALPAGGASQAHENEMVAGQNSHTRMASTTPTTSSSPLPPLPLPPRTSSANILRPLTARKHSHTTYQKLGKDAHEIQTKMETCINCHACRFTMCYTCQTPWHSGLTCAQAEALRQHGDPQPLRTQSWLDAHTKRCPGSGCGFALQKGEGCFHMTCPSCAAQFCWECLADWTGIVVDGRFRREGHAEGCYFRGENAVPPTQIMGRTVERGLRRTRGLFNLT